MKSAITVSLVEQARGGPFVFWEGLEAAFASAHRLGFDAVEIFPPSPEAIAPEIVLPLIKQYGLKVAAVGTGAGWVAHRLHFVHAEAEVRARAREFASRMIEAAAALQAPAVIGSMQGRYEGEVSREQGVTWLGEALEELGAAAERHGQALFYEPLNRYETNLFHRLSDTLAFLEGLRAPNLKILADLFHMSIEEVSIPLAIRAACGRIGHFHFADSNRHAVGFGHTDVVPVIAALQEIGYEGYLSGEVLPLPESEAAAAQTMRAYQRFVLGQVIDD